MFRRIAVSCIFLAGAFQLVAAEEPGVLSVTAAQRFADLALACVHKEYPNKISHVLASDADVKPPRELTPAFCGCFDWHSAVHGHWLLVRLMRTFPDALFRSEGAGRDLTEPNGRAHRLRGALPGGSRALGLRASYGLAWLLQLATEIREWDDPQAREWEQALRPLERASAAHIKAWLPKLSHPIRIGEHSQTAFALGLILDWARTTGTTR